MIWYTASERLPLLYDDGWRNLSELVLVEDIHGQYWTAWLQGEKEEFADEPYLKWIQFGRDGYQYKLEHIKRWGVIV